MQSLADFHNSSPRRLTGCFCFIYKKRLYNFSEEKYNAYRNSEPVAGWRSVQRVFQEEIMEKSEKQVRLEQLYDLIAGISDPEEIRLLFDDLCTRKEVENMAERVFAARLLMEGNTYNQVMAQADISSATLSRVSRCVQYGSGYSRLLKKG